MKNQEQSKDILSEYMQAVKITYIQSDDAHKVFDQ